MFQNITHPHTCPPLRQGEVHIWSASLSESASRKDLYESYLDERETKRARRYSTELARTRFIVARGILRDLLATYTKSEPGAIKFRYGARGKPYLAKSNFQQLYFNSTDSESEAMYAFCFGGELGIDLELESRKVRHKMIASRKFSSLEHQIYMECEEGERKKYFLSVWTRKEAYGKARGVGIWYPLNSVDLVTDQRLSSVVVRDDSDVTWEVLKIAPAKGMIATLVTEGIGWKLRGFRLCQ